MSCKYRTYISGTAGWSEESTRIQRKTATGEEEETRGDEEERRGSQENDRRKEEEITGGRKREYTETSSIEAS